MYTTDAQRVNYPMDADYVFYLQQPTKMFVYNVKPVLFDIYLALAIIAYLILFHLIVKVSILAWWMCREEVEEEEEREKCWMKRHAQTNDHSCELI